MSLNNSQKITLSFKEEEKTCRTQQHFAAKCDIREMAKRFAKLYDMGNPVSVNGKTPFYGDFSELPDLPERINQVNQANEAWERIPATIRARFGNDISQLCKFVADKKNRDEAEKLGLLQAKIMPEIKEVKLSEESIQKLGESIAKKQIKKTIEEHII